MKKSEWTIDGDNGSFATLAEVKRHISLWTESEQRQYDGERIFHIVDGEVVTSCLMSFAAGKLTFGKVEKY